MSILYRLYNTPFPFAFASLLLISMSTQIVVIESLGVSPIKVCIMGFSMIVFFIYTPYASKSILYSLIYWLICFFLALFQPEMRFSTLGYLGLYLAAYVAFYNIIHIGTFKLEQFKRILSFLICAYCITLILQQICVVIGIRNFPLLNLFDYYGLYKLPSLSCEPSHTARIICAAMLGYIRCLEIERGEKIVVKTLFNKENRFITLAFLWMIFTMGSGTGWIGFGILCIYFIRIRTIYYILPLMLCFILTMHFSKNKQFMRAIAATEATLTGDTKAIFETDVSASVRIVPLVNTLTNLDLTKKESWLGNGTILNKEKDKWRWRDLTRKISIVEQYGIIGLCTSLLLIYTCAIRRFFSIETLYYIILLLCSLGNEYFTWSMIYIFTAIRYFQSKSILNECINHNR